jgi:hypothetical protein
LNEKQCEPERKNQSMEMQKQRQRASAEQRFQVVGPRETGENNQDCANSSPRIKTAA